MAIEIIKGRTATLSGVVYSTWTGYASTSTVADISGGTVKAYFKNSEFDLDASAVVTLTGSVVSGPAGTYTVPILASDTNALTQRDLFYEVVVKVGATTYYGSGSDVITLLNNVGKTLF